MADWRAAVRQAFLEWESCKCSKCLTEEFDPTGCLEERVGEILDAALAEHDAALRVGGNLFVYGVDLPAPLLWDGAMEHELTDADLDRLAALCHAATPGPITVDHDPDDVETPWWAVAPSAGYPGESHPVGHFYQERDANLFGAARDALPRLLAEVRRWRAEELTRSATLKAQARRLYSDVAEEIEDA